MLAWSSLWYVVGGVMVWGAGCLAVWGWLYAATKEEKPHDLD